MNGFPSLFQGSKTIAGFFLPRQSGVDLQSHNDSSRPRSHSGYSTAFRKLWAFHRRENGPGAEDVSVIDDLLVRGIRPFNLHNEISEVYISPQPAYRARGMESCITRQYKSLQVSSRVFPDNLLLVPFTFFLLKMSSIVWICRPCAAPTMSVPRSFGRPQTSTTRTAILIPHARGDDEVAKKVF